MNQEFEINQDNTDNLLTTLGVDRVVGSSIRVNAKGNPVMTLVSSESTFEINAGNALRDLQSGRVRPFIERLSSFLKVTDEDVTAVDLLREKAFRMACSTVLGGENLGSNLFLRQLADLPINLVPVFYGSTSGINFAEVLETAFCSKVLIEQGFNSSVVFDFESLASTRSRAIFTSYREILNESLQKQADRFLTDNQSLISARLQAIENLLAEVGDLPKIDFIDGLDVFRQLDNDFPFTLGQLLLMTRIAGQNPRLFSAKDKFTGQPIVFDKDNLLQKTGLNDIEAIRQTVGQFLGTTRQPAGFSYYARDARIGQFDGVIGIPFKLTDKANIYKIMEPLGSLFSPDQGRGMVLLPISRLRIQSRFISEPVDPVVLGILATNNQLAFQRLVRDVQKDFRVLSADQAVAAGTKDKKLFLEGYFRKELT